MDSIVLDLIIIIMLRISLCRDTFVFQIRLHYFRQNFDFAGLIESFEPLLDINQKLVCDRRIFSPNNWLDIKCIRLAFLIEFPIVIRELINAFFRILVLPIIDTWPLDVLPEIINVFECFLGLRAFIL